MEAQPSDHRTTGPKTRRFRPWANIIRLFRRKESTAGNEHLRGSMRKGTSLRRSSRLSSSVSFDCLKIKQATEMAISEPKPIPGRSYEEVEAATRLSESQESKDSVLGMVEVECHETSNSEAAAVDSNSPSLMPLNHLAELRAAIRRRRSSDDCDEEDLGLPHSPASASLGTAEILSSSLLNHGNTTRSTGSDASLLSVGTLENEEEIPNSILSGISSYGSLQQEARIQMLKQDKKIPERSDVDSQLSHSAARHKISVRPKKTHALPRHRRQQQLTAMTRGLPATAEINEDLFQTSTEQTATVHEAHKKAEEVQADAESNVRARTLGTGIPQPQQSRSQSLTRSDLSSSQSYNSSASSTKLARSKSSVDKKIQYEVVNFWRRIREKEAADNLQGVTTLSPRSETRKNKQLKEDKSRNKGSTDILESSFDSSVSFAPQPFLSRIFGSKRSSSRRKQEKSKINLKPDSPAKHAETFAQDSSTQIRQQNKELETIEVAPETISSTRNVEETEEKPSLPRFSGPQHHKRITTFKKAATDTPTCDLATDDVSLKAEEHEMKQISASSNRAKIHIAGLSPYQRRVARAGNSLDIDTDAEFDESPKKVDQQLTRGLKSLVAKNSTSMSEARKDLENVTRDRDLDRLNITNEAESKVEIIMDESTIHLSNPEVTGVPPSSPSLSTESSSEDVQDKSLEKLSDCEEVFVEVSQQVYESLPPPTAKPHPSPRTQEGLAEHATDGKLVEKTSPQAPEFLQVQLQKVEPKTATNVVFDTETRITAASPKGLRKQRPKSFETSVVRKESRAGRFDRRDPGIQPTVSERQEPSAESSSGVFVMNVRVRNTASSGPFLGRTFSNPAERTDVRPVVVLVKNGVPTVTDVPKGNDHEHVGKHVKDPFQSKTRTQLSVEDQILNASPGVKAIEVGVTDASKEIVIQESQQETKIRGKSSPRDKLTALLSTENYAERASSSDMKLRHRASKEVAPPSISNEQPELMKVFARRSLKFSEEINDVGVHVAGQSSDRETDSGFPDSIFHEAVPEKVTSATEDYENIQNVWRKMVPQKKILNKNQSFATEEKLKLCENVEVPKTFQTRQSKVLDLVNNFQRLQVL